MERIYHVRIGNMFINPFSDRYEFENKEEILALYDTDMDRFEEEINKIKYSIKIIN